MANLTAYNNAGNLVKVSIPSKVNGLEVKPSTKEDKALIEKIIDNEGFYAEYNSEFNVFEFPEENVDSLEMELSKFFNRNGINASFSTY